MSPSPEPPETRLPSAAVGHRCRFCDAALEHTFVDLGMSPPANSYVAPEHLDRGEVFYPLHTYVCAECFLVQLPEWKKPEDIFTDYAYFSSYSDSWLEHCRAYVDAMVERLDLGPDHTVVEVASNDGYLLQYFAPHGVPVLGIEPAKNVARAAEERGVPTVVDFFGTEVAREVKRKLEDDGRRADLLLGNNVLAHTPHLNDFVAGLKILLADDGIVTLEFPHLLRLVESNQFDTIYHEHFSYFGFRTVRHVLARHGLEIFDVDELPTHGGSLRIYARHEESEGVVADAVHELAEREISRGYDTLEPYVGFGERVKATKRRLLRTLLDLHEGGAKVVGYGAPAKGVTFLNYCGIGPDLLPYTVDRSPHKQGHHLPGVHIPIHPPERIFDDRPDVVWILPWNLRGEIEAQMGRIREWGGRFLVAIPEVELA